MNAKMNMDMSLRDVQEQAEDSVKHVRNLSRKAFYIYAGVWGMAYDQVKYLLDNSMKLVDTAEQRGEAMVQDVNKRVDTFRGQANDKVVQWRGDVEQRVHEAGVELTESVKNVERRAEQAMERLGLTGDRATVKPVTIEITETVEMTPVLAEPVIGYNEMTAKEVIEQLGNWSENVLMLVHEYEAAHKNRVTVLSAIDERLTPVEAVPA